MKRPAQVLRVHSGDTLVVALRDLAAGDTVDVGGSVFSIPEAIPAKHKFAARDFAAGDPATMYGVLVGTATRPILTGERIGTDNLTHAATSAEIRHRSAPPWSPPDVSRWRHRNFLGYHRPDGAVGTANHWIVLPLVFCENRNVQLMREALLRPLGYERGSAYEKFVRQLIDDREEGRSDFSALEESAFSSPRRLFPGVDGIKFLSHTLGCGESTGDSESLCGLLAGYITHPNVAGATVLSLGCQKAQIHLLEAEIAKRDPDFSKPLHIFEQQKCRSEKELLGQALRATFLGVAEANELKREPAPLSHLCLGVECGGSDGFSGISANPVIGAVADRLIALGGAGILSEFPELCGAEQDLVDRCQSPELARRFLQLMESYGQAARRVGSGFDQNPSFGNIADGLITDAIKSAGAARKGGTSPVRDVLDYPEKVSRRGLSLLCTPGNDVESTTAMAGAGANIMLFSTGLGTPTGNPVTPVIKISSNTRIARDFPDMIDFDTGSLIEGNATIDELAGDLLDRIVRVASGEESTCSQRLGQDDFIPWKRGISL